MDCLTPVVLAALAGQPYPAAAFDPRMLVPPPALDGRPRRYADAKGVYGSSLAHHVDSANFTVQWAGNDSDEAYARTVSATLEAAWTALVEEQGWPAPASSDRYLLWVVLDPGVPGSGYTTTYATAEFPDGYPVSYVSPGYGDADYPGYSRSVAVHEFGHMIQYGVRRWDSTPDESWYWEASAEWMADRGAPALDTYALSTYWYAADPAAAYDSPDGYHPYGMLLLPRYIEDTAGADAVRDGWVENEGAAWPDAIAAGAGQPLGALIPEMAGAYAAGALTDSALFYTPDLLAPTGSDAGGGRYGTRYVRVPRSDAAAFTVTGPAVVRYAADGAWGEAAPDTDSIAAITRTEDGTIAWGADGGADSADDSAGDTAVADTGGDAEAAACGCAAGGAAQAGWGAALAAWLGARRRGACATAGAPRGSAG